jgi:hypothetical protein
VLTPKLSLVPQDNPTETGRVRISEPKHVGVAILFFPADVLGPILQMLIVDRYNYVKIEVGALQDGGYSGVTAFYFSGRLDEEDLT